MRISIYSTPPLLGALLALVLSIFILLKGKRSNGNTAFSLLCIAIFVWLASYAVCYSTTDAALAILFARAACTAVAFVSLFLYHFVVQFLKATSDRKYLVASYIATGLFLYGFLRTNYLLSGAHKYFFGFYSKAGPLHPIYLVITYAMWFRCFYLLYRELKSKEPAVADRNQVKYVLTAFVVAVPATIDYLPKYGIEYYPFGFIFALSLAAITSYTIIKHKLFDIEVVIKRTVQFAGLVAFAALLMAVIPRYLLQAFGIPRLWTDILGAVIVAASFGWVQTRLVNLTDRWLFQKRYDYRELLKKFTDEIMVILDLKRVAEMTVNTLVETVKLEGSTLLLLNKDTRKYEVAAARNAAAKVSGLAEDEPFVTFLRETHEPIGTDGELGKIRFPQEVQNRLKELNARLCLPLNVHDDLIGVLCLGKKKSDEAFSKDELDILIPLSRTLALAVSNAQVVEELKVTQAQAAQKEKLAVIGTLSAGINHEICNPLGIVKAQCEAFLLDQEDGILIGKSGQELLERMGNILRVALKQIDRATAITQKLSNFAKPIKEPTAQPVSVDQEIDEVLMLVGHDLKLEKIEVIKEIEPELPHIVADRRQLQEVLFNLVRNAGQAIAPPGKIWVRAKTQPGGTVRVEIEDTGSGIPPDKLEKIYDPFFTTKEPGKGTGLGLFIVRQIVERNKGRILVESTVGKGTTFFLDFPAAKAPAMAVA